jgi:uncharacterized Ntn-hydrolase superfamily protein
MQSLDRQGKVEKTEIYFSIQGNILAGDAVIEEAVRAFKIAKGSLADRVMAAMEAADAPAATADAPSLSSTSPTVWNYVVGGVDRNGKHGSHSRR